MKTLMNQLKYGAMVALISFSSCSDDDNSYGNDPDPVDPVTVLNQVTYDLEERAVDGISGTATFLENSDNTITINLDINNTPAGGMHPAHIHANTAAEGGDIVLSLEAVNGDTGESSTTFSTLNDGATITYEQLLNFNGYINVHLSAEELSTIVAQGDIGQNDLTGSNVVYDLDSVSDPDISGTATFYERVNGTTLVTVALEGTEMGASHPGHIHENSVAETGAIIVGLTAVEGSTGLSRTQVSSLVGGAAVTYTELLTIDAYINIHLSIDDLATLVAQGNIGSNVNSNTTDATEYDVTNSGASAYIFNGEGLTDASNPDFTFTRGETYIFNVNSPGHPFYINSVQGTGTSNAYNNGVTNNGAVNGTITFIVPDDAPDTLYYNCEFHGSMTGIINIVD